MSDELPNDDIIYSFQDLFSLIRRSRRLIVQVSILFAVLLFFLSLIKPPVFTSEATFREKQSQKSNFGGGGDNSLGSLLSPLSGQEGSFVIPIFTSDKVIKKTIETCGLQLRLYPEGKTLRVIKNFRDNTLTELASWFNWPSKATEYRSQDIAFANVQYTELSPKKLWIYFTGPSSFEVQNASRKKIASGVMGTPVNVESVTFTLQSTGQKNLQGQNFKLLLEPMYKTMKWVKAALKIKSGQKNKKLIHLSFVGSTPEQGANFLNALMDQYKEYAKAENDRISFDQLQAIEFAKAESFKQFENQLKEFQTVTEGLAGFDGAISTEEANSQLAALKMRYTQELASVEGELSSLKDVMKRGILNPSSPLGAQVVRLNEEVRALELKRNTLLEFFQNQQLESSKAFSPPATGKQVSLEQEKVRYLKLKALLKKLDSEGLQAGAEVESELINLGLEKAVKQLSVSFNGSSQKSGLKETLLKLAEASGRRCQVLKERMHPIVPALSGSEGMTLQSVEAIQSETLSKINQNSIRKQQLKRALEKLEQPNFEASTLSQIIQDPALQASLRKFSELLIQLQDEAGYSTKERARLKRELELQKKSMRLYLQDSLDLADLEKASLEEANYKIREMAFSLVNEKIALLNDQIEKASKAREQELSRQKEILKEQLSQVTKKISLLPKRWVEEKKLTLANNLQTELLRNLSSFFETKSLSQKIDLIESAPIDSALIPIRPADPGLIKKLLIGSILGSILALLWVLCLGFIRGIGVSSENLKIARLRSLGSLKNLKDPKRFQVLRRALYEVLFSESAGDSCPVSYYVASPGHDISAELASLASSTGRKVLLIEANFESSIQPQKPVEGSLLAYFEQKKTPVPKSNAAYDVILSGGKSDFGPEYIASKKFDDLITMYRESYDMILISADAKPLSPSARVYMNKARRLLVGLCDEKVQDVRNAFLGLKETKVGFICFEPEPASLLPAIFR
jgi:hypothetical protein